MLERMWRECSFTVGGNVNWYSQYREQYGGSLKKLKIDLSCDAPISLLDICLEKTIIWKDVWTPLFITALFIIARTWKHPRCPSADEWIRNLWYVYTMEYYSAIKKTAFESEVDETEAYYTEWSKAERKTPIQYTKAYIWNLERW